MTVQSVSPFIHCIYDDENEKRHTKKGSSAGKMLRSSEMNRGYEELPSGQQEIVHISVPADKTIIIIIIEKNSKLLGLEAEQKKA